MSDPLEDPLAAAAGNAAFVMALRGRGFRDTGVLRAMEQVPRAAFAPGPLVAHARRDIALPLPCGAAMGAPSAVALMLSLLRVEPGQAVLEIGSGSGYVTALLVRLGAGRVLGLERYRTLAEDARARLAGLGLAGARIEQADGCAETGPGPYDRILVDGSAAAPSPAWAAALAPGGRLVMALATPAERGWRVYRATPEGLRADPPAGPATSLPAALIPGRARIL